MKLIYVASPYVGDIAENIQFAKEACQFVMNEGHAFFASHLLYPQVLGIPTRYVAAHEMTEREWPFAERHSFCPMRL